MRPKTSTYSDFPFAVKLLGRIPWDKQKCFKKKQVLTPAGDTTCQPHHGCKTLSHLTLISTMATDSSMLAAPDSSEPVVPGRRCSMEAGWIPAAASPERRGSRRCCGSWSPWTPRRGSRPSWTPRRGSRGCRGSRRPRPGTGDRPRPRRVGEEEPGGHVAWRRRILAAAASRGPWPG